MTFSSRTLANAAALRRGPALILATLLTVAGAACHDDDGTGPAATGTVAGTVTSSLVGPLSGVKVTAAPTSGAAPNAVTTGADGKFSVSGVPVSDGKGTLSLAEIPANCTDPGDIAYSGLTRGGTATRDIELDCHELVGTISGTVTSSLGGPLAGVEVEIAPGGDADPVTDTTDADGEYSVSGVPAGAGSVSVTADLPDNCSAPSPAAYEDLADGGTKTVDIIVTCDPTTGTLIVTVLGLMELDGAVSVTGPSSFDTTLTASTTLSELAPGSYTVAADSVVVDDPVVQSRYLAVVGDSSVTVTAGETDTVIVTYAIRTGSGGLWVTNAGNGTISRFAAGQLKESGSPADTTSIGGAGGPMAPAFDREGNLWVSNALGSDLSGYTREQLVSGGSPAPALEISSTALVAPFGLAFDGGGNLWVTNQGNGTIVKFSKAQVDAGGTITPEVILTTTGALNPSGIALDVAGNLWVADYAGDQVVEFTTAQIGASGTVTPAVTIGAASGSLDSPTAIAFDSAGNLWVANMGNSGATPATPASLTRFTPADRAASGTPTPAVTLELWGNLNPFALAFDESGGLWVALQGVSEIVRFAPDLLASGGAAEADVTIGVGAGSHLYSPMGLVFDPAPTNVPIRW